VSVIAEDLHQYKYGYTVNEPDENRVESKLFIASKHEASGQGRGQGRNANHEGPIERVEQRHDVASLLS
jgi:hypothetical protein